MDVAESTLRHAEGPIQRLQGRTLVAPENRLLPQPAGIQVSKQAHHRRQSVLGEEEVRTDERGGVPIRV